MREAMRAVLFELAEDHAIWGERMGGYAGLKADYDAMLDVLKPKEEFLKNRKVPPKELDNFRVDVFRYLYLRSHFEIAGNLDTIALTSRAILEQLEGIRKHLELRLH